MLAVCDSGRGDARIAPEFRSKNVGGADGAEFGIVDFTQCLAMVFGYVPHVPHIGDHGIHGNGIVNCVGVCFAGCAGQHTRFQAFAKIFAVILSLAHDPFSTLLPVCFMITITISIIHDIRAVREPPLPYQCFYNVNACGYINLFFKPWGHNAHRY